jgi:hypothetical protein
VRATKKIKLAYHRVEFNGVYQAGASEELRKVRPETIKKFQDGSGEFFLFVVANMLPAAVLQYERCGEPAESISGSDEQKRRAHSRPKQLAAVVSNIFRTFVFSGGLDTVA